ncbi:MAG TPA: HD-GYP domain-containing protein [Thioalkalivibrio sp.]|nr:HD-GYP domain-containing protein [Thioalkalivibrio sp.]
MIGNVVHAARRLRHRDRRVLALFLLVSLMTLGLGEWAAFHFGIVEQYGIAPVLLRTVVYVAATTTAWAYLLAIGRRHVVTLMRQNEAHYDALLLAYEGALGLKDTYTGGHGRRVAHYAATIAQALALPEEKIAEVENAALLHDIGKIGVPDMILTKPGPLTATERTRIALHAEHGAHLLERIPPLQGLAPAVRHHHERFDGTGYPAGLKGEAIPLAARIIAVADTLDAITTARPYREAAHFDRAITELQRGAGQAFDAQVIASATAPDTETLLRRLYLDTML